MRKCVEHNITSYAVLKWDFDVEHIDTIRGHNLEYRGSMPRLPILVLPAVLKME